MAKEVKFNIKLTVDGKEQLVTATTDVRRLADEVEIARTKASKFRDKMLGFTQVGASFQNAIIGMQQMIGVMQSYTAANAVQVEAETKLATVMRQRMEASDAEIESIKRLASAQQELGVIGDEVQLAGAQQIATFIRQKSSLEVLIPAMNNLLAQQKGLSATGQDAVNVGNLMGKALQGQASALRRVGITFTDAQEQVLKFGAESEKASMLAQIITDNVGNMNAELAKTDAGKAKQMSNALGDMKEEVGALFESIEPAVSAAGELGMAVMGVCTAFNGVRGIYAELLKLVKGLKLNIAATYAQAAASKIAAAAQFLWSKQLYYGKMANIAWAFSAKRAVVQAVAMRAAILGLMAVSGIGIAIAVITGILSLFATKADDVTDSLKNATREARLAQEETERLKEVEKAATDAYTSSSSELETNRQKLKSLIDLKASGKDVSKDEKRIVGQLNDTYGDSMGYFNSVAKWYEALTQNSEAYCRQMVVEAKTRRLANQIAEKETEIHNIRYDEKGGLKRYSNKRKHEQVYTGTGTAGVGTYIEGKEIAGTSELDKANQKVKDGYAVVKNLREQLRAATKEALSIDFKVKGSSARPDSRTTANTGKGGKKDNSELKHIKNAATYKELTNNVSYYQQELEKADITDNEHILTLARAKKAAEDAVTAFKDVTEAATIPTELKTLDDYDRKLQYLRKQKQTANKESIAGIDAEIERIYTARQALEDESVAALRDNEIRTYDQLNNKLAYYNRLLDSGTDQQRKFAQNGINALDRLKEKWDAGLAELKLPKTMDNIKDIDTAISFYSERQQREDADQIQKTQQIIDRLTGKKRVLQLGIELPDMKREADDIDKLIGKERKLKIRAIGFDELTSKIKELQKLLNDIENPVTDNQRKDIESLIDTYNTWRKESISAFDMVQQGWSGIRGIGDSIQNITNALEDNTDGWQKVTAIIDGMIQLYNGFNTVLGIIQMFTTATQASAGAKTAESVATIAAAGAQGKKTATDAGAAAASVPVITANKAATASYMELASAMYFAAHASIPFAGFGIASGYVAASKAIVTAIGLTPFAKGGIVSGPTLALVGEYSGASNNPEIIAPLDKLRSMIQPAGIAGANIRFEIEGRKLVGVMANETRIGSKSGKRTNIRI